MAFLMTLLLLEVTVDGMAAVVGSVTGPFARVI